MLNNDIIANLLREVVIDLKDKNYSKLEKEGTLPNNILEGARKEIESYPGKITLPPQEMFEHFHRYDYYDKEKGICAIEFDLWIDGQESDLTLSAEIFKKENGDYGLRIKDIHVL